MPVIETLFEDREIVVRALRGEPGRPVLVTFGHLARRPEEGGFWASNFVQALGWSGIGFVARRPNWFPEASVRAAAEPVGLCLAAVLAEGGPALGYGHSMGGHAVLRYGRLLRLNHALAISPQLSIGAEEAPWDARFRGFWSPELHRSMRVRAEHLPPVAWIMADLAHPQDGPHARALEAAGATAVHTPWMNHNPVQLLTNREVTGAALRSVIEGDLPGLRRLLRRQRHGAGFWKAGFGAALLAHGRREAGAAMLQGAVSAGLNASHLAEALAEALKRRPARTGLAVEAVAALAVMTPRAWTEWCNQMAAAGHHAEALAVAEAGHASGAADAALLVQLGHLRLLMGQAGPGREVLEQAVRLDAGQGWAWVGLSLARRREGDLAGAAEAGEAATRLRASDPLAWLQHAAALAALDRHAEAEAAYEAALSLGGGEEERAGLARARSKREAAALVERLKATAARMRGGYPEPGLAVPRKRPSLLARLLGRLA